MLNYQRVKWGNKPWKIVSLCAFSFYVKIMGFSNASLQSETCQSSSKLWKISSCCVKSVHSEFGVWKCWNSKKLADRYKVPKDSGNILPSMSSLKGKSTPKCSMCFAICKPSFVSRQNNLCSDSWTASSRFCRKKSSDPIEVPRCIVSQSMCSSVWYKPHLARPLPGRYPKIAVYGLLFPPHMINLWIPICG